MPSRDPARATSRVPVTVTRVVRVPLDAAVGLIAPVDLPSVYTGYGVLPAVTGTRDQVGGWDAVGQTRTVELADGSTLAEELRRYGADGFDYLVHSPTGPLRHLVHDAAASWDLEAAGAGATTVRFTYAFRPRVLRRPLVVAVLAPLWRRYAARSLALVAERAEAQHRAAG